MIGLAPITGVKFLKLLPSRKALARNLPSLKTEWNVHQKGCMKGQK